MVPGDEARGDLGEDCVNYWSHPEAEAELEEAAVYLAEHASPALAEALLLEHERVTGLLVENQQRVPHNDIGMRLRPLGQGSQPLRAG